MENKRWYDKYEETSKALALLKDLDKDLQKKFSKDIIDVATAIKNVNKENDEAPVSIGVERVLGLYQSSGHSRRWYDKAPHLKNAIRAVSTLPENDYLNVMEGICSSVKK